MGNLKMPEKLRVFLTELKSSEAQEVWDYLDENSDAVTEMIRIVVLEVKE